MDSPVPASAAPVVPSPSPPPVTAEPGVFVVDPRRPDALEALGAAGIDGFYRQYGFVILRGLFTGDFMERLTEECQAAQSAVRRGSISSRDGSTQYLDPRYLDAVQPDWASSARSPSTAPDRTSASPNAPAGVGLLPAQAPLPGVAAPPGAAGSPGEAIPPGGAASVPTPDGSPRAGRPAQPPAEGFVNYVEHVEEISPGVRRAARDPLMVALISRLLGADAWMSDSQRSGVVYQDARPGRESGYSRIGWHSDWQAMPSLDVWPGLAFTLHIDGTSPANGFLRVVPGSHRWATPPPYRNVNNVEVPEDARPAGGYTRTPPPFEMPLGFEKVPGEIALYAEPGDLLLHDAYLWHSAARATADGTRRRHVRAGYFGGDRSSYRDQFIKNAAR